MTLDIHQILKMLPHRYPILLVDRVLEFDKGKSIKAIKNVSINEPFFLGHFPHRPVMPGVLIFPCQVLAPYPPTKSGSDAAAFLRFGGYLRSFF